MGGEGDGGGVDEGEGEGEAEGGGDGASDGGAGEGEGAGAAAVMADDPDEPAAGGGRDVQRQLEVLPLGRYCAEIAADVSSLARNAWWSIVDTEQADASDMPGFEPEEGADFFKD